MKRIIYFLASVLIACHAHPGMAQMAVNSDNSDPDPSAMLDVKSTTSGVLVPRMTAGERDLISSPAEGLLVYVTSDSSFYYRQASQWIRIVAGADDDWVISGIHMYSNVTGNVGIGITNPNNLLHVANLSMGASVARFESASETCIELKGGTRIWGLISDNSPDVFCIRDLTTGGGGSDHFAIDATGNVGIGLTAPTTKLDINGQVRIRGGNPGKYRVLTSDANGLGAWEPSRSIRFPDGVFPMTPVTWNFNWGNYVVPSAMNLYITNIYNPNTAGPALAVNGLVMLYGYNNAGANNPFEGPIVANPFFTISAPVTPNVSFNGFLVPATVQSVISAGSVTVPAGMALVITSLCGNGLARLLTINGTMVYNGYGNQDNGSNNYRPVRLPVIAGPGDVVTYNGGTFNGYYITL